VFSEKEVSAQQGEAWFSTRILPYRTIQNAIGGVVVTFTEITRAKALEAQLRSGGADKAPVGKPKQKGRRGRGTSENCHRKAEAEAGADRYGGIPCRPRHKPQIDLGTVKYSTGGNGVGGGTPIWGPGVLFPGSGSGQLGGKASRAGAEYRLGTVKPGDAFTLSSQLNPSGLAPGSYRLAVRLFQPGADQPKAQSWPLTARNTYILFANDLPTVDGNWASNQALKGGWSVLGTVTLR